MIEINEVNKLYSESYNEKHNDHGRKEKLVELPRW